jgi:hypothetical protein
MNMGPWPVFVGVALDEASFQAEVARLGVPEHVAFLPRESAACMHSFVRKDNALTCILAIGSTKGQNKAAVAALVAHEATHAMQVIREDLSPNHPMGDEAEAYLVQYMTQSALEELWQTNTERALAP